MGFNDTQLTLFSHALYRNSSPTNELLTKWESSNAKVSHLYLYLAHMKHRRAMYHLLMFVNDKLKMMYNDFDEHNIDHIEMNNDITNHLQSSSNQMPYRHSTMKNMIPQNSHFFDNFNNNKLSNQSDEEHTLVDLKNEKRNSLKIDIIRSEKSEDYLMRIDDFKISYKELVIATDDFSKDNILGSGGSLLFAPL